jgi:hypothetical protein
LKKIEKLETIYKEFAQTYLGLDNIPKELLFEIRGDVIVQQPTIETNLKRGGEVYKTELRDYFTRELCGKNIPHSGTGSEKQDFLYLMGQEATKKGLSFNKEKFLQSVGWDF